MRGDGPPAVSVVVAVNPHEYAFDVVLDGWAGQRGAGDFEVVVAHDGKRRELEREWEAHRSRHPDTPVRCVECDGIGRGALNNAGVRAARGELLVFSADDARVPPGYVAAHRAFHGALERPGVGVGPIWFLPELRDDPFRRWLEDSGSIFGFSLSQGAIAWNPDFFFVGNASLRRSTWEAVGGFDERFPLDMHEDALFGRALRAAGFRPTLLPRAYAYHDHAVDFDERCEVMRNMGATSPLLPDTERGTGRAVAARDVEALRRRSREADGVAAATGAFGDCRRRWIAGLDLAYAEGLSRARAGGTVSPPRSGG